MDQDIEIDRFADEDGQRSDEEYDDQEDDREVPSDTKKPDMVLTVDLEEEEEEPVVTKRKKGVQYPRRQKPEYLKRNFRDVTKEALLQILKNDKNADIVEKHVYNASVRLAKKKDVVVTTTSPGFLRVYADLVYNLCARITPKNIKTVIENLKADQVEWKEPAFDDFNLLRKMEESVGMQEATEMEDGMYTCRHCGCTKTSQFQLQLRSGDEGMTNFIVCANRKCRKMWKQNN